MPRPVVSVDVGQTGPCCALECCRMPTARLCGGHRCLSCQGNSHGALCFAEETIQEGVFNAVCRLCHKKPPAVMTPAAPAARPAPVTQEFGTQSPHPPSSQGAPPSPGVAGGRSLADIRSDIAHQKNQTWSSSLPFHGHLCLRTDDVLAGGSDQYTSTSSSSSSSSSSSPEVSLSSREASACSSACLSCF